MPVRITCPSCSATLSVKDEFAGRAVRCPKCAGIIPPAPAPPTVSEPEAVATVPPPPPAPAEPEEPAPTGGKITGQPVVRARREAARDDEDRPRRRRDEDEDDRPRGRRDEDDDDHDEPRRRRPRSERDEDAERPRRRRDEDDPPRGRRSRDERDEDTDFDDRPTRRRRPRQQGGSGAGVVFAVVAVSLLVCCGGAGYGVYWFAQQAKETVDKAIEDAKKADTGPPVEAKAEELAKAYKADRAAADAKYKDKTVVVEGKLGDLMFMPGGDVYAHLDGAPPEPGRGLGTIVRCAVAKTDVTKALNVSRGQPVKLKGKCAGYSAPFIDLTDATVEWTGPDPAVRVTASALLAEHARDSVATDQKYNEKPLTLTDAVVESKDGEVAVLVVGTSKKGTGSKIKVTLPFDARKQIANLKPGDRIKTVKGEYAGSSGNTLYVNRAWIVP